ncbi:hypothetical protein D3C74_297130 [compost metagenome]
MNEPHDTFLSNLRLITRQPCVLRDQLRVEIRWTATVQFVKPIRHADRKLGQAAGEHVDFLAAARLHRFSIASIIVEKAVPYGRIIQFTGP